LREIAHRTGLEIVKVYRDHGISGAKGGDKRPGFDALHRAAAKREFDVVMAWSVDRLGRSLQDLVGFLGELLALGVPRRQSACGARPAPPARPADGTDRGSAPRTPDTRHCDAVSCGVGKSWLYGPSIRKVQAPRRMLWCRRSRHDKQHKRDAIEASEGSQKMTVALSIRPPPWVNRHLHARRCVRLVAVTPRRAGSLC
jgi:hypothetical protein